MDLLVRAAAQQEHFDTRVGHDTSDPVASFDEQGMLSSQKYFEQTALNLMADISMAFDPTGLPALIKSVYPRLLEDMFPGSFQHLLAIIIGPDAEVEEHQIKMQSWLRDHSLDHVHHNRTIINMMDESLFASDMEVLRKLVAPLRGDDSEPVFWVNTRKSQASKICEELQYSKNLLEKFNQYLAEAIVAIDTDPLIPMKAVQNSMYNESYQGLRQVRMESAAGTMQWDSINKLEIENSWLHQNFKRRICRTSPEKAIQMGFVPPDNPSFPKEILERLAVSLPVWSGNESQNIVLDIIMKTAIWLALARGFAALHLFCDTVHHFTFVKPDRSITYSRAFFLENLVTLRPSDAVRVPSNSMRELYPSSHQDGFDPNPEYFEDISKSYHTLLDELYKVPSLIRKPHMPENLANSKVPLGNVNSNAGVSNRMPSGWLSNSEVFGAMARQIDVSSDEMSPDTSTGSAMFHTPELGPASSSGASGGASDGGLSGPAIDASDSAFFRPSIGSSVDVSHSAEAEDTATVNEEPDGVTTETVDDFYSDSNRSSESTGDFENVYHADAIPDEVPTYGKNYVAGSSNDADIESNSSQALVSTDESVDGLLAVPRLRRMRLWTDRSRRDLEYDTLDDESDDYDEH